MGRVRPVSYTHGVWDAPLLGETIGANLDRTVAIHGDRDALVDRVTGVRWSYREFAAEVDAVALGLLEAGIGKGDRVGIWSPNRAEWTLVQFATAKIGAILVNINPAYRSEEVRYVITQAGIRMLISAREHKSSNYAEIIGRVRPECPDLEQVVLFDSAEWEALVAAGRAADPARLAEAGARLAADDPINIQYTSGTTGFPKGATLSHHNILNNGYFVGELCGYTEADRICIPVPFYHCFGMVMGNLAATSHGAAMVIPAASFEPRATLTAVAEERCTSLYGVPTMFIAELADPDFESFDLSSLRTGIMAGSPCPVEVMKQVIERMGMAEVSICYGMTETSPVSTQTRRDDTITQRTATVGRVGPHLEIKIVDPDTGLTVPRGEPGELCTRGYSVMLGYWNDPDKTAEAIDAARWMHTGDLATMDDDGYVAITGRIKDMVIRGGENIYPREIEEFLYTHPDILDAQVVGIPDPKYGEELVAWIRMREGAATLDAQTLAQFCGGRLAYYKIPRHVHVVEEFPMTVTGKVRKVDIRATSVRLFGVPEQDQQQTGEQ
ncbi:MULTISPECIES: AMP-binding protein [Nocardia]|uniref:AMP-binding protein n=1 Tax=Nocardia TaxID=1817 RepID=UPI0007A53983|nr:MULTISPECIES: AMP-binding protein [Nocardia]OBF82901.1 AMP-binding protein [Mycobacterium sp. 852002-51759_SCH5129042]MBF6276342.1 AMP-binding protein [Nocardia nova]MBV7705772.1 AMP-binding protein [Nocardia nova]OBA46038.1 AMP-binding protein [Nocardia sp. 852002-51101_SCH5132738]OBB43192.1 AMP-binding protein [Nocardia sp. 852002-51244_SCH5132740]